MSNEETIDDVKQAYALLFKAHGAVVSERDALASRVRELEAFVKEYVEAWEDGMAGDSYLLRLARAALTANTSGADHE